VLVGRKRKAIVLYGRRCNEGNGGVWLARKEVNGDVLLAGNGRQWWDLDEGKEGNGLVCQTVKERQLSGVDGR